MLLQGEVQRTVRHEEFLWLMGGLCWVFRIPFDAALIAQNFPPSYTLATLHQVARTLGIKTGHCPLPANDAPKVTKKCRASPLVGRRRKSDPRECRASWGLAETSPAGHAFKLPSPEKTEAIYPR